jgi:hypothetical protein
VFTAQVAYSADALDRVNYLEETRLDILGDDPYRGLLEALLLRFQPSLLNILPLYVVLLVLFAVALPLLRWPRLLLAVSLVPYVLVRVTGLNFIAWTGDGWFFDPLAWQFLFMIGAVLAYSPPAMPRRRWPFDVISVVVLVAGVITIWVIDMHPRISGLLPEPVIRFVVTEDKTGLHPFRLFSILALLWLTVRLVPFDATWLQSRLAAPFVLIGQNSLPVFCAGIFFGFIARLGLEYDDGAAMQVGANLAGALVMVGIGGLAAWYRSKGRRPSRAPAALPVVARTDTG